MKLYKNNKTGEMYVSMNEKGENLLRFDGSPYNGNTDEVTEVDTSPSIPPDFEISSFRRCHIIEEEFKLSEDKDWHLKDVMYVPVDGKEIAFRVEHSSNDKIYFVAVDAVGKITTMDMNQFLDVYLSKMPRSLVDRMVDIEHKANGKLVRKSKLALLSYANVAKDTEKYKLDGADDIPFDGLLTEAERCKNSENGETNWYWLDTPRGDYSTYFLGIGIHGWASYYNGASNTGAVVPCFALPKEPKGNGKYLVKVREIYEHTYYVEAKSCDEAFEIVSDNSGGCDTSDDYVDAEYEVSIYNENDPGMYDVVKAD